MIQRRSIAGPAGFLFAGTLLASLLGFGMLYDRQARSTTEAAMRVLDRDLAAEGWSAEVRRVAAWAIRSNDHASLPFLVIDQARGRVFAFDGNGLLAGSTPILHGPEWTDDGAPAGRFVADTRRSARVGVIVWANDSDTLSVLAASPDWKGRPVPVRDQRYRHGRSLHVASEFYRQHLHAFRQQAGVAYVLPGMLDMGRGQGLYAAGAAGRDARSAA